MKAKTEMAKCELRLGHLRKAATLFREALDIYGGYGPAIAGLARTYARMGRGEDARDLYMSYLEVNPKGTDAAEAKAFLGR